MCTAMAMQTSQGGPFFGRTMDFSYPLEPELYIAAKGYEWINTLGTHKICNQFQFMGIGQNISPVVFADGVNERGFAAAVLYFPGYAHYDIYNARDPRQPIAALELVGFLLGSCATLDQAASLLPTIQIIGSKDSVTNSVAPLHWIIADESGQCKVIEKMADGLHILDNPIGILSNSPDFSWHLTNLRNYMNVVPSQQPEAVWSSVPLTPFGQGGGSMGLPGDYTPPARFVRAAYLKSHIQPPTGQLEAVNACFHIMESVSIPKGIVITSRGASDYTQYTAFMDLGAKQYFFKTYDHSQILSAKLAENPHFDAKMMSLGKLS
ncbi:choloylglycine hydrolase family protein [Oscillospiraceae bacterium NSJ-54]|uniref:Choloylglycine hydrolase family protein n=2 Tax=Zongyangia hominis TaxID=2763677 RepID=A0A926EDL0_9FIRM|nr:choloylglycine hydrolase family protein [Zongyangia hominis]MBC8570171.1 choloylglycine hydrolase family protein [Zongyangia hominis]